RAHARHAALHVAETDDRIRNDEVLVVLVRHAVGAVLDRHLEVQRAAFATGTDEPHLSVVVHAEAPLAAIGARVLADNTGGRPADPERVVGAVDPVVEAPDEPALLVFEVAVAAHADARVPDLAPVGHAI